MMIKGLEYPSYEKRLRVLQLFSLERRHTRGNFINGYKSLKEGCKEENNGLFSVAPSDGKRANRYKEKVLSEHQEIHFLLGQWLSIERGCGICHVWWTYSNPPRHYAGKRTIGDTSLVQVLDQRTSKIPFHHQSFCDSVKEFKIMLSNGGGNTRWNKMPFKKPKWSSCFWYRYNLCCSKCTPDFFLLVSHSPLFILPKERKPNFVRKRVDRLEIWLLFPS